MTRANDAHEFSTVTVVPVENVRPYVPAQFRILGASTVTWPGLYAEFTPAP